MTDYGHDLLFGTFLTPLADEHEHVVALAQLTEQVGLDLVTVQDHPYQARFLTPKGEFAYGGKPTANEAVRDDESRRAVATKCTFCVERLDAGVEKGLKPGVDPEATPACVNACIAEALAFGDIEDPKSNVSRLLARNQHFRINEELGTGPGFHYLWDKK